MMQCVNVASSPFPQVCDQRYPVGMLTGQKILGYSLEANLGQHPLGEVYRGTVPEGDMADVKVLAPDLAGDPAVRQRFVQEAALLRGLNHPGLVKVLEAETEGERLSLITEYVGGFTLKDILERRSRLSFVEALAVIPRVMNAVEHAHQASVVHWGLCPGLIWLEPSGNTRIADLGVARILGEARPMPSDVNAVYYMSPEQVQGRPDVDHRADIYSLAVVFYEALTGRVPFSGNGGQDAAEVDAKVKEAHCKQPPPDPRDLRPALPDGMSSVLTRALAKDPLQRFQSLGEMLATIKSAEWGRVTLPTGKVPQVRKERSTGSGPAVPVETPAKQTAEKKKGSGKAAPVFPVDTYRLVCRKYRETGQIDRAWCICAVLSYLKQAESEEQTFYEQHRPASFQLAPGVMNQDTWRQHLLHPDGDRFIGAVMGTIAPTVSAMMARPHKAFALKPEEKRDLASDQLLFSRIFRHISGMLGLVQPDLYLKPEQQSGLMMAHTAEVPSFVVGADMLRGRSEEELAFTIGWQLSYLRPEHFLCNVLGEPSKFKAVFYAAMKIAEPEFPVPMDDLPAVEQTIKSMRTKLHSSVVEHISTLVHKYDAIRTGSNLSRWWSMVELTANRTGLVACNNLEVAANKILTSPQTVGALPPAERLMDVLLFTVSENYSAIRTQLGLDVGQG